MLGQGLLTWVASSGQPGPPSEAALPGRWYRPWPCLFEARDCMVAMVAPNGPEEAREREDGVEHLYLGQLG